MNLFIKYVAIIALSALIYAQPTNTTFDKPNFFNKMLTSFKWIKPTAFGAVVLAGVFNYKTLADKATTLVFTDLKNDQKHLNNTAGAFEERYKNLREYFEKKNN